MALLDTAAPLAIQTSAAFDLLADAVSQVCAGDEAQLTISSYSTFFNR